VPRRDCVHLSRQFLGGEDGLLKEDIGERDYRAFIVTKLADDLGTEHGADEAVNYATENLTERVMALTDGKGADVCFDSIGGDLFDAAFSALG
jgi:NADPH:quinone reductase-like Zn-dependent oxidoreductase